MDYSMQLLLFIVLPTNINNHYVDYFFVELFFYVLRVNYNVLSKD